MRHILHFSFSSFFIIFVFLSFILSNKDPDVDRTFEEIVISNGFLINTYIVKTKDFYNLSLFQIVNPHHSKPGQPVLLMHGLVDSSDSWVSNDVKRSFPFILSSKGYDVWIGNNRGNKYSRSNDKISPENKEFWNFSLHEMGIYDLPAMIDFIINHSNYNKVVYIGHSQGAGQFFAFCSILPKYCKESIKGMIGLGPAVYLDNLESGIIKDMMKLGVLGVLEKANVNELFTSKDDKSIKIICEKMPLVCKKELNLISDRDNKNDNNLDRLQVFLSHFPSGGSLKSHQHFEKIVKTKMFIELKTNNKYPIENVSVPIYLHSGHDDLLVNPVDSERLFLEIKQEYRKKHIIYEKMGHLSFFLSKGQENYFENVEMQVDEISSS